MGYSSAFLVSGVVFVQHLFNCDGSSDVPALCIRDLHDQQAEHMCAVEMQRWGT